MIIKYTNKFIQNMGMGDPKTFFYRLIFDQDDSNATNIIKYFIMNEL